VRMAARNPNSRLPDYVLRDESGWTEFKRLGRDPFDDGGHFVLLPQVDARGAYRREDRARAVLVTLACVFSFIALAGVAWALLRRFAT